MDVRLQNAYVEVLLGNFMEVVKQNLMFQAQIEVNKTSGSNDSLKQEKDRLQSAVNDYMRQLKETQQEVLKVKSESQNVLLQNNNRIEELTKYVTRLEAVVPANKLKRVKLGEVIQSDTPEITVEEPVLPIGDDIVKSGGTF